MPASDDLDNMQREAEAKGMAPTPITPPVDAQPVPPGVESTTGEYHPPAIIPEVLPAVGDTEPGTLLTLAIQRGLDVTALERLMDLQERWSAGKAKQAYFAALARFQEHMPSIQKNAVVDYTTDKGHTHYKHATLDAIADAIRAPLAKEGLSYTFQIDNEGERVTATAIGKHIQGHSESTSISGPVDPSGRKNPIQAIGSAITYLKKYALTSLFGLSTTDEDTDAAEDNPRREASEGQPAPAKPAQATPRPATGTSQPAQASSGAVYMGTEGQPIQIDALKKGDRVRGIVNSLKGAWCRIDHFNASIMMSRPYGAKPGEAAPAWPACVKDGALVEITVAHVMLSAVKTGPDGKKTGGNPMCYISAAVPVEGPDPAKGPQAPSSPTPPPAQKPDPREKSLAACKNWIAYLGDRSLDIQKTHFGLAADGSTINAPETADLAHLNTFWADATKLDKAPKEEPAADPTVEDPPF